MGYSAERKAAVLKRMLAPNHLALRRLSQDEGVSEALHKGRTEARGKGQLLPGADSGPRFWPPDSGPAGWTSCDKFAAVLGTAALNAADLAEYCRKRGVLPAQIKAWRGACEQANDRARIGIGIGIGIGAGAARLSRATKAEKKRIRDLARALARQIGSGADPIA